MARRTAPSSTTRTARLAEKAFARLQEALIVGKLKEGEVIRESRLARQWNLSRTPLREAVRRASECGYLILRPNQAPLVRKLTADDIRHLYSLREVLESLAFKDAWDHFPLPEIGDLRKLARQIRTLPDSRRKLQLQFSLDRRLHSLWIDHCQNPWLTSILDRLLRFRPNLAGVLQGRTPLVNRAFDEHVEILEAIRARNRKAAAAGLKRHIQSSARTLAVLGKNNF